MNPEIVLVAALDENRAIGRNGELPWRLRDDLKAFKSLTLGAPVVMGRKTWESLGRPLPDRQNIVLTRNPDLRAEGADVIGSPAEVRDITGEVPRLFVIGGGSIYEAFLPMADRLVLTRVHTRVEGADAWFPEWDSSAWSLLNSESVSADERNEFAFTIETYGPSRPAC